jgi:hypothetical protein
VNFLERLDINRLNNNVTQKFKKKRFSWVAILPLWGLDKINSKYEINRLKLKSVESSRNYINESRYPEFQFPESRFPESHEFLVQWVRLVRWVRWVRWVRFPVLSFQATLSNFEQLCFLNNYEQLRFLCNFEQLRLSSNFEQMRLSSNFEQL